MSNLLPENDPMFINDVALQPVGSNQAMEMMEMQAMEETILEYESISPEATKKAYNPKIREFQVWCNDAYLRLPIEQRYTVTGPKLHLFLKTMVCVIYFSRKLCI